MTFGGAAVGLAHVWHRRNAPAVHEFTYDINQIWLDPDRPQDLFDHHRLWSTSRPSPIRFKRSDYFDDNTEPIGPQVRTMLTEALGNVPAGPVRMLTQPRTWGWLFNPITVYLVWDGGDHPVGAVLEVTNTPWKERVHYPLSLSHDGDSHHARFAKELHVSPFLDLDYHYGLTVSESPVLDDPSARDLVVGIDVLPLRRPDREAKPIVETELRVRLVSPSPRTLGNLIRRAPLPTHRVSLGIHWQAAQLATKRVPFIPHPGKQS